MALARYFVIAQDDDWLVTLEGRTMGRHAMRREAVESAIVMADLMGAMGHDADVMVQSRGAEAPELVWTYGIDPMPGNEPSGDAIPSHVRQVQRAAAGVAP